MIIDHFDVVSPEDGVDVFDFFLVDIVTAVMKVVLKRDDYDLSWVDGIGKFLQLSVSYALRWLSKDTVSACTILFQNVFSLQHSFVFYNEFGVDQTLSVEYLFYEKDNKTIFTNERWEISLYILANANTFIDLGGHEKILSLIPTLRFIDIKNILNSVYGKIHDLLIEELQIKVITEIFDAITNSLDSKDNKYLQSEDKEAFDFLFNSLRNMIETLEIETLLNQIDSYRLNFSLRWLSLPVLDKRLFGLNEIKYYLNTDFEDSDSLSSNSLSSLFLVEWIKEKELLNILFGSSLHPQLIQRCGDVITHLAFYNSLDDGALDMIWNATLDSHETICHIIWALLEETSYSFSTENFEHIFDKILSVPKTSYDFQFLSFLRTLSEFALKRAPEKDFGVKIFWDMFQDNTLSKDICEAAVNELITMIDHNACQEHIEDLIKKSIQNMRNGLVVLESIRVLRACLNTFNSRRSIISLNNMLKNIDQDEEVIEILLNDLSNTTKTGNSIDNLQERLNFLTFILSNSSLSLNRNQLERLWQSTIGSVSDMPTRDIMYQWLINSSDSNAYYPVFDSEDITHIFESLIPQIEVASFSLNAMNMFETFFKRLNTDNGTLITKRMRTSNSYYTKEYYSSASPTGYEQLWEIALNSTSEEVGYSALSLLNSTQKNLEIDIDTEQEEREKYITKCLDVLSDPNSSSLQHVRAFTLVKNLIDSFDSNSEEISHCSSFSSNKISIVVTISKKQRFNIEIFENETVGKLKDTISDLCKHPSKYLQFEYSGEVLSNNQEILSDTGVQNGSSVEVSKNFSRSGSALENQPTNVPYEDHPSRILEREENFHKLFDLLDNPNIGDQVWNVLMRLPTNSVLQNAFYNLTEGTDINLILDTSNVYKLYYSLQIIESIFENWEQEDIENWKTIFITLGGVNYLVHTLDQFDIFKSSGQKSVACLNQLLKVVNALLSSHEAQEHIVEDPKQLISLLLDLTLEFSQKDNIPQKIPQAPPHSDPFFIPQKNKLPPISPVLQYTTNDRAISEALSLVNYLVVSDKSLEEYFVSFDGLNNWIGSLIMQTPLTATRIATKGFLNDICQTTQNPSLVKLIVEYLFQCLSQIEDIPEPLEYLEALSELLEFGVGQQFLQSNLEKELHLIIELIQKHPIVEKRGSDEEDLHLVGLLTLAKTIIMSNKDLLQSYGERLVELVYDECLFNIPLSDSDLISGPPKCKTQVSRKAGLELLDVLSNEQTILVNLCKKLLQEHDYLGYDVPGNYYPKLYEKSIEHVGLKNLGTTCYMNSLLQQFYMNDKFRYQILSAPLEDSNDGENLLLQLQTIFAHLQESVKKFFVPTGFTQAYKGWDGEPMNVLVQMDAEEFFNMLFDKLENLLSGTPQSSVLENYYGGYLVYQVISKECEHTSERREKFYTMSVGVQGKRKITESLDLFIQGDMLDGDNKYHCEKCDKKVKAVRRCCIDELPNNLIIHLRRFEFDIELMARRKVNEECSFDFLLNMEEYTKEGIEANEKEEKGEKVMRVNNREFYDYELTGILVHTGTTESGHYYSFIRDNDDHDKWFQFDDRRVSVLSKEDIPYECFGGTYTKKKWSSGKMDYVTKVYEKPYSAYMLFYRKIHQSTDNIPKLEENPQNSFVPEMLYKTIMKDNQRFLRENHLFDKEYFNFMTNFEKKFDMLSDAKDTELFLQLCSNFYVQTLSNAYFTENILEFSNRLSELLGKDPCYARWFLTLLNEHTEILSSLVFRSGTSGEQTSIPFVMLVIKVFSILRDSEKDSYNEFESYVNVSEESSEDFPELYQSVKGTPTSIIIKIVEKVLDMHIHYEDRVRFYDSLWIFLQEFASLGNEECMYLLNRNLLPVFIHHYLGEDSPYSFDENSDSDAQLVQPPSLIPLLSLIKELLYNSQTSDREKHLYCLPDDDIALIQCDQFVSHITGDGLDTDLARDIVQFICNGNYSASKKFITAACQGISDYEHQGFQPFLQTLYAVIDFQDKNREHRLSAALGLFLKVCVKNVQYATETYVCVKFLNEILEIEGVSEYLVENYDTWFHPLCYHKNSKVRAITVKVIQNLNERTEEEDFKEMADNVLSRRII
eukprot:TRINITY_DN4802_c0_g1_i1.p1 TRINITY_DN4802_c0_g1~~TRINITY_DN4802_c0_g1_i1.p1  ORF type:complete len:2081 (-),score=416.76 TRINITY_DN4802_c0_g1_i1:9-6251(-)